MICLFQAGPLPQSIIDAQFELQGRILARMRSLGMTPVLPAFAGFVPAGLKKHFPDVRSWSVFCLVFADPIW